MLFAEEMFRKTTLGSILENQCPITLDVALPLVSIPFNTLSLSPHAKQGV